ncbi:MAG: glutathione-dependent formaldehyde dehydrogenase [Candidatus Dormibacteraeota bacterium]|nr:glutathione-dependent formaldehyde dehydrogenase [Candidatus Dormibacteraeota bacterium]
MKAVVFKHRNKIKVEKVPDPTIQDETDAIIRITATAICGSDLHLYDKIVPGMKRGDILGHEPMGIVEEVGSEVRHISPGDRVVIPFNISCGHCFMCEAGLYSQCETTQNRQWRKGGSLFGYTHLYGGVPGGQAEFLRVPQAHFGPIKIHNGAPDTRLVLLADVLPTAWQAVEYAQVPEGGTLAIWGLGPIGQAALRIAKHRGIERVIGVDKVPERLAMAQRHGAEAIDLRQVDDPVEDILDKTQGRGADAAIDAVGFEAAGSKADSVLQTVKLQPDKLNALMSAIASIRRGGTLSIAGVYLGYIPVFHIGDLFDRQITIRMGQANVRRWSDEILPLIEEEDRLGVDDLVTHVLPLEEAKHAYDIFQKKEDGAIKIVLQPGRPNETQKKR